MAQMWGLGLSVFGGGKLALPFWPPFKDFACGRATPVISLEICSESSKIWLRKSRVDLRGSLPFPLAPSVRLLGPVAPVGGGAGIEAGAIAESWLIFVSASISKIATGSA